MKTTLKTTLAVALFFLVTAAEAQEILTGDSVRRIYPIVYRTERDTILYKKPAVFDILTNQPRIFKNAFQTTFSSKSLPALGIIGASTLILIPLDQSIKNSVNRFSNFIHLDPTRKYRTLVHFKIGSMQVNGYDQPRNLNSVLYSIGEGSTSVAIDVGLVVYGAIAKDKRALSTASQLMQSLVAVGITTQILKRVAGRQSPFAATESGGRWRPFPNLGTYQKSVSSYDAFPSGHLATMMATTTVLADNYPEKKWIRYTGYGLTGVVGLAMINNGVHWAGDYPLALGIGYLFGKATTRMNRWIKNEKLR